MKKADIKTKGRADYAREAIEKSLAVDKHIWTEQESADLLRAALPAGYRFHGHGTLMYHAAQYICALVEERAMLQRQIYDMQLSFNEIEDVVLAWTDQSDD